MELVDLVGRRVGFLLSKPDGSSNRVQVAIRAGVGVFRDARVLVELDGDDVVIEARPSWVDQLQAARDERTKEFFRGADYVLSVEVAALTSQELARSISDVTSQ